MINTEEEIWLPWVCNFCGQSKEILNEIELGDGWYLQEEEKNYQDWVRLKGKLHNSQASRVRFHEREIWGCNLGENIGFEQDGKGKEFLRPVIVVRKFNQEVLWIVPLTTAGKEDSPYYFNFSFKEGIRSSAILSQIRLIDAKRLSYLMGYASKSDFFDIKKKLKEFLP